MHWPQLVASSPPAVATNRLQPAKSVCIVPAVCIVQPYLPATAGRHVSTRICPQTPPTLFADRSWSPSPWRCSEIITCDSIEQPQLGASNPPVFITNCLRPFSPAADGCHVPASVRHKQPPTIFNSKIWSLRHNQCLSLAAIDTIHQPQLVSSSAPVFGSNRLHPSPSVDAGRLILTSVRLKPPSPLVSCRSQSRRSR